MREDVITRRVMKLSILVMGLATLVLVPGCGAAEAPPTQAPATPRPAAPPQPASVVATVAPLQPQQPATPLPALPAPTAVLPAVQAGLVAPTPAPVAPRATPSPTITGQPKPGGILRWIPQGSVATLDPLFSTAAISRTFGYHMFDTPLALNEQGLLQPQVADKWVIEENGKKYTFTLREGLKFHDGRPVTVEDALASISRWEKRDAYLRFFKVASKDKIDEKTFVIQLEEPSGVLLAGLGKPANAQAIIVPQELAATSAFESMPKYIGSGPLKFVSWDPGSKIVLEKFTDYKPRPEPPSFLSGGKVVYLDRLDMLEVPDVETRVAALLTGEVDFLDVISGDFYDRLRRSDRVQTIIGRPGATPLVFFNKSKPPFDMSPKGLLMRKAIQALVNAEEVMLGYGPKELWTLCPTGIAFCGTFWETSAGAEEAYNQNNIEKAKQLLKEAGYAGEPIILLDPTDFSTIHPIPIVLKVQMERAGINVDYRATDWASMVSLLQAPEGSPSRLQWDIFPTWNSLAYHPLNNQLIADGDLGYYKSPAMNELRIKLSKETDIIKAKTIMDEMQKVFYEEVPYVHMGQFFQLRAMNKDLKGYLEQPVSGASYFINLWWDNPSRRGR